MITAKDVTKSYTNGKTTTAVLKGVSLTVNKGELAVILGASGSGKSTLLSVLSGLECADGGEILVNGENLTAMTDKERALFRRKTVGFVFQQYFLLPHLTVEGNVKLGANLAGNPDFSALLEAVGLADKRKRYPAELSGGEQQRVSIARALAKQPEILFLDEPTGALDEETGRSVLDFLTRLQKESGFTAVMVTHNPNVAEMANRVLHVNSGKIDKEYENAAPKGAYEIGW